VESETIHRLLKATPFQAFRLFLSNGLTYDVRHPELALVGKRDMLIGSPASGYTHPTFESFDIVSLLHINGVQLVPVSGTSNGPLK